MGSISAYQTESGKCYWAMFRKPDHAQTQKRGFKTKRGGLFLASVEIDKSRGADIDPSKSRVLVGEWPDAWMDGLMAAPTGAQLHKNELAALSRTTSSPRSVATRSGR